MGKTTNLTIYKSKYQYLMYSNALTLNNFTKKILANKMAEFVGSDVHNLKQIEYFDKKIKLSKFDELNRIINNNIEKFS